MTVDKEMLGKADQLIGDLDDIAKDRDEEGLGLPHYFEADNRKMREKVLAFAAQQVEERTEECCKAVCLFCAQGLKPDASQMFHYQKDRVYSCLAYPIRLRFGKGGNDASNV